ncbi:hypothetical protein BXZ70DRAFT_920554 [Cristinia sonorae]|uniref:FHA domain-containing protein n=1 Tax=Cristinia sonorae TaxID=1940300 RepID=A0A8K0XTX9_9AGAR|nr:hypothetical protein BXZ70DRAFT_920554 [Cristinia sonorae]
MDYRALNRSGSAGEIAGITLTVDECGSQPARVLKFWKANGRVIEIGRRSAQAKSDEDDGKHALFRCPVISRKHAKITFSEYGNVYITDLKSHHGTYILRPGDTVSKPIAAQVPSVLTDGDVLTFGKAVGKEQDLVQPVSVRVQLQLSQDSEPAPIVATPTSLPKASTGTGRYGVFLPPSDISSSSSESDSDVEEISPPFPAPSLQTHGFEFSPRRYNLASHTSSALRREILPPISLFLTPSPEPPLFRFNRRAVTDLDTSSDDSEEFITLAPIPPAPRSPQAVSAAAAFEIPELVGAWRYSPILEHPPARSPSRTHVDENADSHVSAASVAPAQSEEHRKSPALADITDSNDDDLYADFEAFAPSIVPAKPQPSMEDPQDEPISTEAVTSQLDHDDQQAAEHDDRPAPQAPLPGTSQQQELIHTAGTESDNTEPVRPVAANSDVVMTDAETVASGGVLALQSLKEAMAEMQAKAQKEIEDELAALRAARAEAEAVMAQWQTKRDALIQQDVAPLAAASLKRKRDSDDDMQDMHVQVGIPIPPTIVPAPKRRRIMRIVSAVAQTTAVATIGAVAAWTALAFT